MSNSHPGTSEASDLLAVGVDAVCDPCSIGHPTDLFEVLDRSAMMGLLAVTILVGILREVRMQSNVESFGKFCTFSHQPGTDRKR